MIVGTCSGNVVRDAELKRTKDAGDYVLEFTVASNDHVKGEKVATFIRCSLWGKRAEALSPHVTKGTRICCTGILSVRSYVLQGETKFSVDLNAHHIDLLGGGKKDEARQERERDVPMSKRLPERSGPDTTFGGNNDSEEDLPF